MISRRDKLLVQPWEERRFKDHRSKITLIQPGLASSQVQSALPAIDTRAPPARPHVALKMKKWQGEAERARRITRDNYSLLQRLAAIMRRNRLDNHWVTSLPNFHHKVGLFYDAESLHSKLTARSADRHSDPAVAAKCYACHHKQKSEDEAAVKRNSLPFLYY